VPALSTTSEFRDFGPDGIRAAGPADHDEVCATLAAAFADGPIADWVLPNPAHRGVIYRAYSRLLCDDALALGTVHTTNDHSGATVWYSHPRETPPPARPDDDEELGHLLAAAVPLELLEPAHQAAARLTQLESVLAAHEPDRPHAHLAFAGVWPDRQCEGIGNRLLDYQHRQLDAASTDAFLIATSPRSRNLYTRHGYQVLTRVSQSPVPDLWPMWREPR
jgi:ribosomal protein S18 acetylase RimI-like enzyme